MTVRDWECIVQVHGLTRVCTYNAATSPCTCTNPLPVSVTARHRRTG
jgi:hypothetical protein